MPDSTSSADSVNEPDDTATEEVAETDAPLNRAERRAKGKHKTQSSLTVNKINPGKSNQAHAQRNFSSRRSGG